MVGEDEEKLGRRLEGSSFILVVLSEGASGVSRFSTVVVAAHTVGLPITPLRADSSFIFPDPAFWETFKAGKVVPEAELLTITIAGASMSFTLGQVEAGVMKLFTALALPFRATLHPRA